MKTKFRPHRLIVPSIVAGFVLLALMVVWGIWWLASPGFLEGDYNRASASGEMFGSLNALFTAFTFSGLVFTIFLQFQQLETSQEELDDAQRTSEDQRFESTFFHLLNLFTGVIDSMSVGIYGQNGYETVRGRDVLLQLSTGLLGTLRGDDDENTPPELSKQKRSGALEDRYMDWYEKRSIYVAHYFRVLYRLLQHVDKSAVRSKASYAKMVRALLSEQELIMLFYNSFAPHGIKMRYYIERYALLKHIPDNFLAVPTDRDLYPDSAYDDDAAQAKRDHRPKHENQHGR